MEVPDFIKELNYLILKHEDINKYLNDEAIAVLQELCRTIQAGRCLDGKTDHMYVCVKDTWPMYDDVWEMVGDYVDTLKG